MNLFTKRTPSSTSESEPVLPSQSSESAKGPPPSEAVERPNLNSSTNKPVGQSAEVPPSNTVTQSQNHNPDESLEKPNTESTGKGFYLSSEETLSLIKQYFEGKTAHNYFYCHYHECSKISDTEAERIRPKKFLHDWIKHETWWLTLIEGEGMYCLICKKHATKNMQNKSEKFTEVPADRFKIHAIDTHMKSERHRGAIQSELLGRVSMFHHEYVERKELRTDVLVKAFSVAYLLMKEFIPNRKFLTIIDFIKDTIKVKELSYFNHRSDTSVREIFLTLGKVIKEYTLKKVRDSEFYGILTDEMTDIAVVSQLVTFVQFFDCESEKIETNFLSVQNVMEQYTSANSEAIYNLLKDELQLCNLDQNKMIGLATDGAAVMTGARSGVAQRLKQDNPVLINIHCICHKLALACTDSNESIKYIKQVEDTLRQLWQHFENSPKRMAVFMKVLGGIRKVSGLSDKNSKKLVKKLQKACKTRWLSFDRSVSVVKRDYEGILLALRELDEQNDATASGLLKKMNSVKFLGVIYILCHILPILSCLSVLFQRSTVNFSAISPQIDHTKAELMRVSSEKTPLSELQSDIDSYSNLSKELKMSPRDFKETETILDKYTTALVDNIDRRFKDSNDIISALSILDPFGIPNPENEPDQFRNFGNDEIRILGGHFYQTDSNKEHKQEKLKAEWLQMKYQMHNIKNSYPEDSKLTPTEWFLLYLLKRKRSYAPFFPLFMSIAEAVLCIPVSNAWPERGASSIKNIKTRLRSRLTNTMLEGILHIQINGPPVNKSNELVREAVDVWLKAKPRRKLPKAKAEGNRTSDGKQEETCVHIVETNEIGIQKDLEEEEEEVQESESSQFNAAAKALDLDDDDEDDDDDDDDEDDDEDDLSFFRSI